MRMADYASPPVPTALPQAAPEPGNPSPGQLTADKVYTQFSVARLYFCNSLNKFVTMIFFLQF